MKQNVYIVGSKGIPAKYGGFETFVDKLTECSTEKDVQYHIACMTENSIKSNINKKEFVYNNASCFNIDVPSIGPGRAIYYDLKALEYAIAKAKNNKDKNPIFYILACRIGPFISKYKKQIEKLNGQLFVNPDGHEWLRKKWSKPVRKYWKESEKLMVKHADLLICDSKNIEKYIQSEYQKYKPKTVYIAYGTDLEKSSLVSNDRKVKNWYDEKKIKENNYYLVVGRFVPENNYETIIKEFMKSDTKKDLVIITNVEKNKFYNRLKKNTNFEKDLRIKFVGTVYDSDLLKYIRENAYSYIHGHEVGGTNPSLLEAMASTKLNLLLDVGFNREVGQDGAIYWRKNNLNELLNQVDELDSDTINFLNNKSKKIIINYFTWEDISQKYNCIFMRRR